MNTKEAFHKLLDIFGDFTIHKSFLAEINKLLKKELSGKEEPFFRMLVAQLNNLKIFGHMIHTIDGHEKLKGLDGHYYSIHLQQSQFNVRLLVYINDSNNIYFLSAFYERSGKKSTDYSTHTSVLEQRLNELLGVDNNE